MTLPMGSNNELQELEQMFRELQNHPPVMLQLNAIDAWTFISLIQIALRHPGSVGETADAVKEAMLKMQNSMLLTERMKEYLNRGWEPEYDRQIEEYKEFITVKAEDFILLSDAFGLACSVAAITTNSTYEEIEKTAKIRAVERFDNYSDAEKANAIREYYESLRNEK